MDHALVAIKRMCQAGRLAFTEKAQIEMLRDGLSRQDVLEAILNADRITKRLRSSNPQTGRQETLYVISSTTWSGTPVYTKGKISSEPEGDRFYVMISSKRSVAS
ncbi:MAG: hypothetical protein DCC65_14605 [Planctomycetota bacterium]|nr:MAG: hypothetical protein DCC65_14605 [Planctomycetota bacterium]